MLLFDALSACALCFSPFITFKNEKSSFTKHQDMFPVILALCFILKIFRCSKHYAPNVVLVFSFVFQKT